MLSSLFFVSNSAQLRNSFWRHCVKELWQADPSAFAISVNASQEAFELGVARQIEVLVTLLMMNLSRPHRHGSHCGHSGAMGLEVLYELLASQEASLQRVKLAKDGAQADCQVPFDVLADTLNGCFSFDALSEQPNELELGFE